jgi:ADP-heptose:LPS heptosyltransferase
MVPPPADALRTILVIKWGALGDLIAATTALRALREALPAARITVLANPLLGEIAPPGTLIDDLVVVPGGGSKPLARLGREVRLVGALRSRRFDLAINLRWTSERSAVLAWLSGARLRAGSGPAAFSGLYTHRAPLHAGRRHEFLRHLDILEPLGIVPQRILPFVHVSADARAAAETFCHTRAFHRSSTVGMHPGASRPSKAWPAERYAELARRLAASGLQVLVTWGPGEEALAREVSGRAGGNVVVAPPTPRVGGLAALIASCSVFVCNYSGPMNVAMAVETPLVALGSTSPEDWGPFGDIHRTINKAGERDSYTEEEQLAMMERIGEEEVEELVKARIREVHRPSTGVNGR